MGPQLAKLLRPELQIPRECRRPVDEVHLIMEYPRGARWGASAQKQAPQANRFIVSHDVINSQLYGAELLTQVVDRARAQLLHCQWAARPGKPAGREMAGPFDCFVQPIAQFKRWSCCCTPRIGQYDQHYAHE